MKKAIIAAMLAAGCLDIMNSFAAEPLCPSNAYRLDARQLQDNMVKGLRGDAEAAYRVYKYYSMLTKDKYAADAWLFISAKLGNALSQYTLRLFCKEKKITEDRLFILTKEQERDFMKHDEFHIYCLYMHFMQSGDPQKAKIHLVRLKNFDISPLLLQPSGGAKIDFARMKQMSLDELLKYRNEMEQKYFAGEVGIEELNAIQARINELHRQSR